MEKFLDNFYGVLFSPDKTFEKLRENPPLFQGFLIVLFISALAPILDFKGVYGPFELAWFVLSIFGAIFFGVSSWLSFGFFLELLASIFKQSGKIKEFLTLFAFALIPWIFLAPVELFKTDGVVGKLLGMFLGIFIWLWVIVLIIRAMMKAYNLSFGRVLMVIIVPIIGGFLTIYWLIVLFTTLIQLLKT